MSLPDHRRAIHGRSMDRTWRASDYDPITPYRGRGLVWRLAAAVLFWATLAGLGVLLAWRG
jgi:hypothetical protein